MRSTARRSAGGSRRCACALVHAPAIAHRTRAAVRQHAIDDDLADADAGALERGDAVAGFRERELFRQRHPDERGPSRIAQPRRRLARLRREGRDQPIGRLGPPDARELLANEPVLLLQRVEHLGDRRHRFRRRQQAQRVAGRRGVDDDQVVGTVPARRAGRSRASPSARRRRESTDRAARRRPRDRARCRARGSRRAAAGAPAASARTRAARRARRRRAPRRIRLGVAATA